VRGFRTLSEEFPAAPTAADPRVKTRGGSPSSRNRINSGETEPFVRRTESR
jgi:hypothetical protein